MGRALVAVVSSNDTKHFAAGSSGAEGSTSNVDCIRGTIIAVWLQRWVYWGCGGCVVREWWSPACHGAGVVRQRQA